MKQSIRPFENVFSVISLILFSQGFFTIIIGVNSFQESKGDVDSIFLRIVFIFIYFFTGVLLVFRSQKTLAFLKSHLWLVFLLGIAMTSVLWSSIPDIAFRKLISLIGTSLFGLYFGSRYDFKEQLKIYGWVYGISIVCSILFAVALPQIGVMNTVAIVGAWRGIYPHKNGLGQSMVSAFLTFYFLSNLNPKKKLPFVIFSCLAVIVIYFGESATSLISVVFIFALGESLKRLSLQSKKSVFLILLFSLTVCFLLFLFTANFEAFLSANDKDITLSGRTLLWATLWDFIQEKPWFGYGYASFFSSQSRQAQLLWQAHDWHPVNPHNGYIKLWVDVGFVGLTVFCIGYFSSLFKSLYRYLTFRDMQTLWIFLFLIYTVFFNITEVSFLSGNNNIWIMTLACIYSLKRTRSPSKKKYLLNANQKKINT